MRHQTTGIATSDNNSSLGCHWGGRQSATESVPMFKRKANPVDIGVGLLVIVLAIVLFRDSPQVYSIQQPSLNLAIRYLPFYALVSVSRMIAAMILSLIIGLLAGYLAAVNRHWNMLILPTADILQS